MILNWSFYLYRWWRYRIFFT